MSAAVADAIEHEIGPAGLLALRLQSSAVRLRGVDGPMVRIADPTGTLERTVRIERGPGSLSIRAERSFSLDVGPVGIDVAPVGVSAGRRTPDLDVEVPRGATIVIESASGDLSAIGLTGDQRYRTASGEVSLRDVSGRLTLDAVSGDVTVTMAGPADVTARTVSGDLSIRGVQTLGVSRLTTTSGDVNLQARFDGPGPFSLETVSGDTILAPIGGLRLEVKTVTGDVRSDVRSAAEGGRGARTVVIGGGGPTFTIRSISGDVHVVETTRADRIAAPPAPAARGPIPPVPPIAPTAPDAPETPESPEAIATGSSLLGGAGPTPDDPSPSAESSGDAMAILQALERGEIDVDEASRRLEAMGDTTPEREA